VDIAALIERLLAADSDEARLAVIAEIDDLPAVLSAMRQAGASIVDSGDADDETLATLEALAAAASAIEAEQERRNAPSAAERLAALAQSFASETPTEPEPDGGNGDEGDGGDNGNGGDGDAGDSEDDEDDEDEASAPLAAEPSLAELAATTPSVPATPRIEALMPLAAPDVPRFAPDTPIQTMRALADAFIARHGTLGKVSRTSRELAAEKVPVASFSYLDNLKHQASDDWMKNHAIMQMASHPEAMTASGGFCAPAERVYTFVKVNVADDLAQDFLPTVGAARGEIEYPTSPDIRDAFDLPSSNDYTEAMDIAGTPKEVAVIPCPERFTCTVGAETTILQFGNFATRAYPEWVEHWLRLAVDAHAHLVSEKLVQQMVNLSDAQVGVGPSGGFTGTFFSFLSLAAQDLRQDLRLGRSTAVETVLPSWTFELVRSDMAHASKGGLETLGITDAQVMSWFSARNIIPHFVVDWQDIDANDDAGASVWPAGFRFLIYPRGTFVRLDMGVLDLGVVRDSTLNETNDYHIFTESFESVCRPGIESRVYSVSLCANGQFAADQNLNCAGVEIPGS
jgi:hypothetical protein